MILEDLRVLGLCVVGDDLSNIGALLSLYMHLKWLQRLDVVHGVWFTSSKNGGFQVTSRKSVSCETQHTRDFLAAVVEHWHCMWTRLLFTD